MVSWFMVSSFSTQNESKKFDVTFSFTRHNVMNHCGPGLLINESAPAHGEANWRYVTVPLVQTRLAVYELKKGF